MLMKLDVWNGIVYQRTHLKYQKDPMTLGGVGGGNLKSWKTLRVEGSGWNLVGKISRSPRYVIEITGTDFLCLGVRRGEGYF